MTLNKCRPPGQTIRASRGEGSRDKPTLHQFKRRAQKFGVPRNGPTGERPYRPFLDIQRNDTGRREGSVQVLQPDEESPAASVLRFVDGAFAKALGQTAPQYEGDVAEPDQQSLGKTSIGASVLLRALLCASYLAPPTASRVDAASGGQRGRLTPNVGHVYVMPLAQLMAELKAAADSGTLDQQIQVFDQVDVLLSDDRARPASECRAEDTLERFVDKRNERARIALLSNRSLPEIASLFPTRAINAEQIGKTGWYFAEILGLLALAPSAQP